MWEEESGVQVEATIPLMRSDYMSRPNAMIDGIRAFASVIFGAVSELEGHHLMA